MKKYDDASFADAEEVSFIKPSPSGRYILFGVAGKNLEEDRNEAWLWLHDLTSGANRQLTFGDEAAGASWIDDSTIIFSSLRGSARRYADKHKDEPLTVFYTLDVQGGEAKELFRVPVAGARAESIDGNRFLVHGVEDIADKHEDADLYTVYDEFPYHADGDHFGKTNKHRKRIWLFTLDSGEFKALTAPLFQTGQRFRWGFEPFLAEDKRHLYFVGEEFSSRMHRTQNVWALDLETQETRLLFENGKYLIQRAFEFQGRVWFVANSMLADDFYGIDLLSIAQGESDYRVELQPDAFLQSGVADSDRLLLVFAEHKDSVIYSWRPGEQPERLSVPEHAVEGELFKVGERFFYAGRKALDMRQLVELKDGASAALTQVGSKYLAYPLSPTIEFAVLRPEGHTVHGFVVPPHNYVPGKKYPAILWIHGGPQGHYSDKIYPDMQRLAAEGWFVFYCNPRGSTNYGRAHMDLRHKYGTIDFDDIMGFTDGVLAAYPDIDADSLGVTGGSYGGYMTNWVIGHTNRFKAAVSVVSISNQISMFGTTDVPFFVEDGQGGVPWEAAESLWEHSPLKHAGAVATPTLFIQNDEDYRCPTGQAEEMLTALLLRDIPARMILFHGFGHSIWSPKQQRVKLVETIAWFRKYLP